MTAEEKLAEEQQKAQLIATMRRLHPEIQGQGDDPEEFDLAAIVQGMVLGIAAHPDCDDLIPALQQAMDYLGEGHSAEAQIRFWRLPNVLPPLFYHEGDDPHQVAS